MKVLIEKGSSSQEINEAKETLYKAQYFNADSLRKIVIGYNPAQGNRAWASDPDYSLLLLSAFENAVLEKKATARQSGKKKKRKNKPLRKTAY